MEFRYEVPVLLHEPGREFHRILYKKDGHVIPHQIKIALLRVEFDSKSSYIAGEICRAPETRNS